jgi:hypothetical protein
VFVVLLTKKSKRSAELGDELNVVVTDVVEPALAVVFCTIIGEAGFAKTCRFVWSWDDEAPCGSGLNWPLEQPATITEKTAIAKANLFMR